MFLHPYNELRFTVTIESTSPLLIKESRYTDQERKQWSGDDEQVRRRMPNVMPISRADTARLRHAVMASDPLRACADLPFFLPASSLRGVCRSHLERALRSLDPPEQPRVCNPFEPDLSVPDSSCSDTLTSRRDRDAQQKVAQPFIPYRLSCPVCRLFGSTLQASRIAFTEGERVDTRVDALVQREHVRINRRTGAVTGPPLKFFGLLGAQFRFEITLHNFELPHVMLLGVLLADLAQGNIPIGSGRNKGYGRVRLVACEVCLAYITIATPDDKLRGVAEHPDPASRAWYWKRYGLESVNEPPQLPPGSWRSPVPWRHEREIRWTDFGELWRGLKLGWERTPLLATRLLGGA